MPNWTAPRTWVANETVTAAIGNTHWRDNQLASPNAIVTNAGDIVYATAAGAFARLPAVAYRMPRVNAAGNALEYVASLNLAQAPVYVEATGVNMSAGSYVTIVSSAFTSVGGKVLLFANANILETKSAAAGIDHSFTLGRDAGNIGVAMNPLARLDGAYPGRFPVSLICAETPGAGAYTYRVKGSYIAASTSGTPTGAASLLIVELAP